MPDFTNQYREMVDKSREILPFFKKAEEKLWVYSQLYLDIHVLIYGHMRTLRRVCTRHIPIEDIVENINPDEKAEEFGEVLEDKSLVELDFDINKDGVLDEKERDLYKLYKESNKNIIAYAKSTVKYNSRNSLASNIILGVIFLVQAILFFMK